MNYTENYQLPLWDKEDAIKRTDFNDANSKIDAALGSMPKMKLGYYTGTGVEGITVDVGFKPQFVILLCYNGGARYVMFLTDDALHFVTGNTVGINSSNGNVCYLTETGFCLTGANYNTEGGQNTYIAFG